MLRLILRKKYINPNPYDHPFYNSSYKIRKAVVIDDTLGAFSTPQNGEGWGIELAKNASEVETIIIVEKRSGATGRYTNGALGVVNSAVLKIFDRDSLIYIGEIEIAGGSPPNVIVTRRYSDSYMSPHGQPPTTRDAYLTMFNRGMIPPVQVNESQKKNFTLKNLMIQICFLNTTYEAVQ